ncbi:12060_t:CDS:2 [Entrophospora sp. SA101]|nr:12060_t:CDS:2 [Entrophospora sp. SA101]
MFHCTAITFTRDCIITDIFLHFYTILHYIGSLSEGDKFSYWLVHIHTNLPFNANEELSDIDLDAEGQHHSLLWQFIQHSPLYPIDIDGVLRGHLLDSMAHKMIPKNCSVKIQCLETEKKVEASDEIISFGQLTSKQLMKLKMRCIVI